MSKNRRLHKCVTILRRSRLCLLPPFIKVKVCFFFHFHRGWATYYILFLWQLRVCFLNYVHKKGTFKNRKNILAKLFITKMVLLTCYTVTQNNLQILWDACIYFRMYIVQMNTYFTRHLFIFLNIRSADEYISSCLIFMRDNRICVPDEMVSEGINSESWLKQHNPNADPCVAFTYRSHRAVRIFLCVLFH